MKPISFLVLIFLGLAGGARAQGNALITVRIVTPITVNKTFDSYSGTLAMAVPRPASKSNKRSAAAIKPRFQTKHLIDLPAANFQLSGLPSYSYSISLPNAPLTIFKGESSITIKDFSLRYNSSAPDESGFAVNQDITVLASVKLDSTSTAGHYVAPVPINIIINYN